ncbi:MAG: T9SS type A sorting domain-containing protein, partial [Hymenobacteraceae bacterium]|nr:T9SS type A sorting domain-containing protein [Hymenobacteraceae bacterium]MDX5396392.1 T9SS type A sorting domain-containing protein [Hymenobacteraceae bacterium]MDX5512454.1 T9SS type A sorting domain-containing protein [Hymenobacteraceae bacterium]
KNDVMNITFKDAQNGLMIGDGELMRTTNGGQTWTKVIYNGQYHFAGLAYVPGTSGTYVSTGFEQGDEGSSYSTDNGTTWQTLESTRVHTVVKFINATTGWSGGITSSATAGGVHRFTGSLGTTTATPEAFAPNQISLYPNPTKGIFNISATDLTAKALQVSVRNAVGQEVLTLSQPVSGQNQTVTADLSNQPKGMYFVTLVAGEQVLTQKLVVE